MAYMYMSDIDIIVTVAADHSVTVAYMHCPNVHFNKLIQNTTGNIDKPGY